MTNFSGQNMNTICMCGMCFATQIYDSDGFSVSP
ncbi:hypothetical protein LDELB18P2_0262 [Lactobacillus delbrueckii]|nr:hypothetical protein LDELB18P2_0262 [Lactobacillus delbrueckii]